MTGRSYAIVAGALIVVILAILILTQGQIFSMIASAARQPMTDEATDFFDAQRVHDLQTPEPFTILAAGDIADCQPNKRSSQLVRNLLYSLGLPRRTAIPNEGMIATTSMLNDHPDAIILALGDLAYRRGEPASFADCYGPYWGTAKNRTWPIPGNHEYKSRSAYGYYDYWQDRAGPDRQGYYALRSKAWLILGLNSEVDASPGSPQARWIETVLKGNPEKCVAAFYHKPAFSTVARKHSDDARALFQLMAAAGARFVLNGHNHFYERSKPLDGRGRPDEGGTIGFTVGTGGRVTSRQIEAAPFADSLITGTAGMLKLDFSEDGVNWRYLTESNTQGERGIISCHLPDPARGAQHHKLQQGPI